MTSLRRLVLSPTAEDDLRDVLQYSLQMWGEDQRDIYAADLAAAFQKLLTFPELGRSRGDLRTGLRALVVGQHTVLYRAERDVIRVLRIVHRRRDALVQLDE